MNEGESRRDKDKDVRLAGHDVSHSTLQVLKDVMTSAHLAFQKSEASIEGRLLIARARGAVPLGRDSGINIFPPPTSPPTLSPSPHKLPTPKVDKPAEIVSSSTFSICSRELSDTTEATSLSLLTSRTLPRSAAGEDVCSHISRWYWGLGWGCVWVGKVWREDKVSFALPSFLGSC